MTSSIRYGTGLETFGSSFLQGPTQPGALVDQLENWVHQYRDGEISLPGTCRVTEKEVKRLSARSRRAVLELETHWVQIDQDWEEYGLAQALAMEGILSHARGPAGPEMRTAGIVYGLGRNALVLGKVGVRDSKGGRSTAVWDPSIVRKSPEGYRVAVDLLKGKENEDRAFNIVEFEIGQLPLGDS